MSRIAKTPLLLTSLLLLAAGARSASAKPWNQVAEPTSAGWSEAGLQRAEKVAAEVGSASVMAVDHGVVIAAWGQVRRPFPLYSMRKGMYDTLMGMLVADGKVNLDATLQQLGIDDLGGLSPAERRTTVKRLLTSTSCVHHRSAYEPASMKRHRPQRGSRDNPWFYNNWDFNVVAHLIEEASGKPLAELFRDRVAHPLGMEDFSLQDVFSFWEPSRSRYPAIIFRLSARDLARVGQLYLQQGLWQGHRLLPASWVRASWSPAVTFPQGSPWGAGNGFGYLWWIYSGDGAHTPFPGHDVFLTRGSRGQVLAVVPSLQLVVVHQTDTENGQGEGFHAAARVIAAVIAAKASARSAAHGPAAKTVDLRAKPLPDALPAPPRHTAVPWTAKAIAQLTGEYALNAHVSFRIHVVDGRLFALPQGAPLAEVELFADSRGKLFSPAVDLSLTPVRDAQGKVVALEGRIDHHPARIERKSARPASP